MLSTETSRKMPRRDPIPGRPSHELTAGSLTRDRAIVTTEAGRDLTRREMIATLIRAGYSPSPRTGG